MCLQPPYFYIRWTSFQKHSILHIRNANARSYKKETYLHWTKILLSCPTLRLLGDRFYHAFFLNGVIFSTRLTWTRSSWRRHTYTPVDGGRGEMTLRCVSSFDTDWRCGGLFFRLRHKLRWALVWIIWSVSMLIVLILVVWVLSGWRSC